MNITEQTIARHDKEITTLQDVSRTLTKLLIKYDERTNLFEDRMLRLEASQERLEASQRQTDTQIAELTKDSHEAKERWDLLRNVVIEMREENDRRFAENDKRLNLLEGKFELLIQRIDLWFERNSNGKH